MRSFRWRGPEDGTLLVALRGYVGSSYRFYFCVWYTLIVFVLLVLLDTPTARPGIRGLRTIAKDRGVGSPIPGSPLGSPVSAKSSVVAASPRPEENLRMLRWHQLRYALRIQRWWRR